MKESGERGILLFEYFWKKLRRKLWGIKDLKENTHKEGNENDEDDISNTGIAADLALVRGLDGGFQGRGVDKEALLNLLISKTT